MLSEVDAENLPQFLGGNCTCEEFGGCMKGNQGPWNDYELVEPVGIKRKHASEKKDREEEEEKKA